MNSQASHINVQNTAAYAVGNHAGIRFQLGSGAGGTPAVVARATGGTDALPYGALDFYYSTNGDMARGMTLDSNGYVGIGTAGPIEQLQLSGNFMKAGAWSRYGTTPGTAGGIIGNGTLAGYNPLFGAGAAGSVGDSSVDTAGDDRRRRACRPHGLMVKFQSVYYHIDTIILMSIIRHG